MAPLPPENTNRLFVEYTSAGRQHTMLVRLSDADDETTAVGVYDTLTAALAPGMSTTDSFTGARFAAVGNVNSFPLAVSAVPGTGAVVSDPDRAASFVGIAGRGSDGRRTTLHFYTGNLQPDTDGYRLLTPTGWAGDFLDAVNELEPSIVTISKSQPIWQTYLNLGYGAYWQRQLRKGF